jgi:2-polyprenyl-3-methyl-5-hydroxy-6-metoxy-1,4-benzoquinol methylase
MFKVETVPCPLCGAKEYDPFIKDAPELYIGTGHCFDVVQCRVCGLCYTNPRPRKEDIGYFYPDTSGYYANKCDAGEIEGRFKGVVGFVKKLVLSRVFGYRHLLPSLSWVPSFLVKPLVLFGGDADMPVYHERGWLLEIGCSTGSYLKKMASLGWKVAGVELNASAVTFAREELGLEDVHAGFFEDFSFDKGSFHVVRAAMVLEHVYDPRGFVRRVQQILAPGGDFIFSIPDIDGLEIKWYGRYAYCLQVPQHLSHFSVSTISALLREEGFEVVGIRHHAFDRDLVASSNYAGKKALSAVLHNTLVRKFLVGPFVWLLAIFGKTSRMTVRARKR